MTTQDSNICWTVELIEDKHIFSIVFLMFMETKLKNSTKDTYYRLTIWLYNYIVINTANDLENTSQIGNTLTMMYNNPDRNYSVCMTRLSSNVPNCEVNWVQAPRQYKGPGTQSPARDNNATHHTSNHQHNSYSTSDKPHYCNDERPHGTTVLKHATERPLAMTRSLKSVHESYVIIHVCINHEATTTTVHSVIYKWICFLSKGKQKLLIELSITAPWE